MTLKTWLNNMLLMCSLPPAAIIWHLSMDKVPSWELGIQEEDCEIPVSSKTKESCF